VFSRHAIARRVGCHITDGENAELHCGSFSAPNQ
jgi:hypothetical protein